jgi:hypothetical protein
VIACQFNPADGGKFPKSEIVGGGGSDFLKKRLLKANGACSGAGGSLISPPLFALPEEDFPAGRLKVFRDVTTNIQPTNKRHSE